MSTRLARVRRDLSAFPRQYWILVAGTFLYCTGAGVGFPWIGIYLQDELDVSLSIVGLFFGVTAVAGLPLQLVGGSLTDRFGRRPMLLLAAAIGVGWFIGMALVRDVVFITVLGCIEAAFGWSLFLTANNAMVADLIDEPGRPEAYSIVQVALNVGYVLGPAGAGIARGAGVSFPTIFVASAAGCAAFFLLTALFIRESRPAAAVEATAGAGLHADVAAVGGGGVQPFVHDATVPRRREGYGRLLHDRRFLLFCLVAVLPFFCFNQFETVFAIFVTDGLAVSQGTWGLLLGLSALIIAVGEYPLVRALRHVEPMYLLAVSSALLGLGFGAALILQPLWPVVVVVVVVSLAECLLLPISSTVVSDLAPAEVRGRYMGMWTVASNIGITLGPAVGGLAMDAFGYREAFAITLAAGIGGALLLPLLGGRRSTAPAT